MKSRENLSKRMKEGLERLKETRTEDIYKNDKAQISFALVAIVLLVMSVFAGAYFSRLNRERRSAALEETSLREMDSELNDVENELESAVEEAGHQAIEKVEDNLLDIQEGASGSREDVVNAVQENTSKLFEEYFYKNYGEPRYIGSQRINATLYPERVLGESVEVKTGEVYMQNGTQMDWVEMPLYFRHNRTLHLNIYDESMGTQMSERIHITREIKSSFLLLANQVEEFDWRRVDEIANAILFPLAYGRVYSSELDNRLQIGYYEGRSVFEQFGLTGLVEFIDDSIFSDDDEFDDAWDAFWDGADEDFEPGDNYDESDREDYYEEKMNDTGVMTGFYDDKGGVNPSELMNEVEIEMAYNLAIILEQMRVFQDYDDEMIEDVVETINEIASVGNEIEEDTLTEWLGSGKNNRVNPQALSIMIFTETGVIDDEVFTAGPFLEKYGDEGFMSLVQEEWHETTFYLILQVLNAGWSVVKNVTENIGDEGIVGTISELSATLEAELGYITELLGFALQSFSHVWESFHLEDDELKDYVINQIVEEWLGGGFTISIGWPINEEIDIGEKIARGILAVIDLATFPFNAVMDDHDITSYQILYILAFGPFASEIELEEDDFQEDAEMLALDAIKGYLYQDKGADIDFEEIEKVDESLETHFDDERSDLDDYDESAIKDQTDEIESTLDDFCPEDNLATTMNIEEEENDRYASDVNSGELEDNSSELIEENHHPIIANVNSADRILDDDDDDPAYFEVNDVEVTTDEDDVYEGEEIDVSYTIENTGDLEDTQDIVFLVEDEVEADNELTLDGGDSYSDEFTWQADDVDPDDYELEVESENDSDDDTVTFEEADFNIDSVDLDVCCVCVDEDSTLQISVSIENKGDVSEEQDVSLYFAGDEKGEETVSISARESESITLEWDLGDESEPESNEIEIETEDDSFEDDFTISNFNHAEAEIYKATDMLDKIAGEDWFMWEDENGPGEGNEAYQTEDFENYWDKVSDWDDPEDIIGEELVLCHNDDESEIEDIIEDLIEIGETRYKYEIYDSMYNDLDGLDDSDLEQLLVLGDEGNGEFSEIGNLGTTFSFLDDEYEDDNDLKLAEEFRESIESDHGADALEETIGYHVDENIDEDYEFGEDYESETRELVDSSGDTHPNKADTGLFALFDRINSNMVDLTTKERDENRLAQILRKGEDPDCGIDEGLNIDDSSIGYNDVFDESVSQYISGEDIDHLGEFRISEVLSNSWEKTNAAPGEMRDWSEEYNKGMSEWDDDEPEDWHLISGYSSFYNLAADIIESMEDKVPRYLDNITDREPLFEYEKEDMDEDKALINTPVINAPRSEFTVRTESGGEEYTIDVCVDDSMDYIEFEDIYVLEDEEEEEDPDGELGKRMTGTRIFETLGDTEDEELRTSYLNPFCEEWMDSYMTTLSFEINTDELAGGGERLISVTARSDDFPELSRYSEVGYKMEKCMGDPSVSNQLFTPLPVVEDMYSPQSPLEVDIDDVTLNRNVFSTDDFEDGDFVEPEDGVHLTFTDDVTGCSAGNEYRISVVAMVDNQNVPTRAQLTMNFLGGLFGSDRFSNYKVMAQGTVVNFCEEEYEDEYDSDRDDYEEEMRDEGYYIDESNDASRVKIDLTSSFEGNWSSIPDDEDRPLFINRVNKPLNYDYRVSANSIRTLTDDDEYSEQFQYNPSQTHNEQGFIQHGSENEDPRITAFNVSNENRERAFEFTSTSNIPRDYWLVEDEGIPFLVDFEDNPYIRASLAASVQMDKLMSNHEQQYLSMLTSVLPENIIEEAIIALLPESEYRDVRRFEYIPVIKTAQTEDGPVRFPDRLVPLPTFAFTGAGSDLPFEMWDELEDTVRERQTPLRMAVDPKIIASAGGVLMDLNNNLSFLEGVFDFIGEGHLDEIVGFEEGLDFMQGAYLEYFIGYSESSDDVNESLRVSRIMWRALGVYHDARDTLAIALEVAEIAATVATLGGYAKAAQALDTITDVLDAANTVLEKAEDRYQDLKDEIGEEEWEDREEEFREATREAYATAGNDAEEWIDNARERPQFNMTAIMDLYCRYGVEEGNEILDSIEISSEGEEGSYCEVEGGDTESFNEYIKNVQFNGIDRDSGDDGGYADHTDNVSEPVVPGESYELSISMNIRDDNGTKWNNHASVVFDWSQDYDLSNEEVIKVGNGSDENPLVVSTDIEVPEDAEEGETRMRVMQEFNYYHTEPCEDQVFGETEDYTVLVDEGERDYTDVERGKYNNILQSLLNFDRPDDWEPSELVDNLEVELERVDLSLIDILDYNISDIQTIDNLEDLDDELYPDSDLEIVRDLLGQGYDLDTIYDLVFKTSYLDANEKLDHLYKATETFNDTYGISVYQTEIEEEVSEGEISAFRRLKYAAQLKNEEGREVELYPFGEDELTPLLVDDRYKSYIPVEDHEDLSDLSLYDEEIFEQMGARGKVIIETTAGAEIEETIDSLIDELDQYDPYREKIGQIEIMDRDRSAVARITMSPHPRITYL